MTILAFVLALLLTGAIGLLEGKASAFLMAEKGIFLILIGLALDILGSVWMAIRSIKREENKWSSEK